MTKSGSKLTVRPSELMCCICRLGEGRSLDDLGNRRLTHIIQTIRRNPRIRTEWGLYAGNRYNGRDAEAPEGVLLGLYRDAVIREGLTRLKPYNSGIAMLTTVADQIKAPDGICCFESVSGPAWRGCSKARKGYYQKGCERTRALRLEWLPSANGFQTKAKLAEIHRRNGQAIQRADKIRIFPSHLLFTIAHYGGHMDVPEPKPVADDNMHEVYRAIRANPEIPVEFVLQGCMFCPPCGGFDPGGSGLCGIRPLDLTTAEKDTGLVVLRLLQTLGMEYGRPMPAIQLIKRAFARLPLDHQAFTYKGCPPSPWAFAKAREAGMGFIDAWENPAGVVRRVRVLLAQPIVRRAAPRPEWEHAREVIEKAAHALRQKRRREAYDILVEPTFWNFWKIYLERIPRAYVRLPRGLSARPAAVRDGLPCAAARRVHGRVECDGKLKDRVWRSAAFVSGFRTMVDRPALAETAFQVLHDGRNLHIGIVCAEKRMAALQGNARLGADLKQTAANRYPWLEVDDSVLIVIQPDEKKPVYFNFMVNAMGIKLGDRRDGEHGRAITYLPENSWQAAASAGRQAWMVQMAVPLREFGRIPGKSWRINVHRFFGNERLEPQSWSYAVRRIDDLSRLGRLEFGK